MLKKAAGFFHFTLLLLFLPSPGRPFPVAGQVSTLCGDPEAQKNAVGDAFHSASEPEPAEAEAPRETAKTTAVDTVEAPKVSRSKHSQATW